MEDDLSCQISGRHSADGSERSAVSAPLQLTKYGHFVCRTYRKEGQIDFRRLSSKTSESGSSTPETGAHAGVKPSECLNLTTWGLYMNPRTTSTVTKKKPKIFQALGWRDIEVQRGNLKVPYSTHFFQTLVEQPCTINYSGRGGANTRLGVWLLTGESDQ